MRTAKILGFDFYEKEDCVMFVGASGCMGDWGYIDEMTFDEVLDYYHTHTKSEMYDLIACNM